MLPQSTNQLIAAAYTRNHQLAAPNTYACLRWSLHDTRRCLPMGAGIPRVNGSGSRWLHGIRIYHVHGWMRYARPRHGTRHDVLRPREVCMMLSCIQGHLQYVHTGLSMQSQEGFM